MTQASALSAEQIEAYDRDGYLIIRGAFGPEEVAAMAAECDRLFADESMIDPANLRTFTRASIDGGTVVDRFDPVRDISPVFDRLTGDPRLVGPARALLRSEAFLLKDKIIAKFPGVHGYTLHQDYAYWEAVGIPADDFLTGYVSIDANHEANGALEFVLGYHHQQLNRPGVMEDVDEADLDMSRAVLIETDPGDVVFFHTLVPHRSAPNRSDRSRRLLYFTYNAGRHGDIYERYYRTYRERRMGELPEELRARAYFR